MGLIGNRRTLRVLHSHTGIGCWRRVMDELRGWNMSLGEFGCRDWIIWRKTHWGVY